MSVDKIRNWIVILQLLKKMLRDAASVVFLISIPTFLIYDITRIEVISKAVAILVLASCVCMLVSSIADLLSMVFETCYEKKIARE